MDEYNVSQVMQSRIIQLVPVIEFKEKIYLSHDQVAGMVEQLFRALVAGELSQLKKLQDSTCGNLDLSSIDADLFSEAVIRLEDFYHYSTVSTDSHRAVLNKIIETEDLKLKSYYIWWRYLVGIPPNTFMKAAVKLEQTNIHHSFFFF